MARATGRRDAGWKATVNGRSTGVIRANYNFRAVAVPAGTSKVNFSYGPTSVTLGVGVSVLSSGLIGYAVLSGWPRHRRMTRRARSLARTASPENQRGRGPHWPARPSARTKR